MEQGNGRRDGGRLPEIPNDIADLVADIRGREAQRQKAIEIMHKRANNAISADERDMWLLRARDMEDIRDEYRGNNPEIFK